MTGAPAGHDPLLRYSGAVARDGAVAAWLASRAEPLGAVARAWFAVMRSAGPDVRELMHDGNAVVSVDDAPFAYVGVFSAHVNVGFFQGATLPDPGGLLVGTGKRMRHVKLKPGTAVDDAALRALIAASYRDIVAKVKAGR